MSVQNEPVVRGQGPCPVLTDAPRFGEWRDISTAPTMEAVLVFGGEVRYPVVASWTGMADEPWCLDALENLHDEIDWPTHWMPLPANPDDGALAPHALGTGGQP